MENEGEAPSTMLLQQELQRAAVAASALYPGADRADPKDEAKRRHQESALSASEREAAAFQCLQLTANHFKSNRNVLKQVVSISAPQNGMRGDDLLVLLLHQRWAGCYYESLALPASSSFDSLSAQEVEGLMRVHEVPTRFSQQMLQDLDLAIQRFAVSNALYSRDAYLKPDGPNSTTSTAASYGGPSAHNGVSASFGLHAVNVVSILVILSLLVPVLSFFWQCLWSPTISSEKGDAAEVESKKKELCNTSPKKIKKGAHVEGAAKEGGPGDTVGRRKASAASQRGVPLKGARGGPLRSS